VVVLLVSFGMCQLRASMLHIHPTFTPDTTSLMLTSDKSDSEEKHFQEYLNGLFDIRGRTIDTSGWCTYRINSDRFDYRQLTDSVKIPLVDAKNSRFFTYPLKTNVTSPFGPRRSYWHFGTDFKVFYRDTIRCAFDGIVRIVTNDRYGYGKVAVVRHHYGLETLYSHMAVTLVKNNQVLKSGDVIGLGGRTGRATGNHLHFEIRFCGEPFDPASLFDFDNFCLKSDTLVVSHRTFEHVADLRKTVFHRIAQGDNLGRIAKNYGTSISTLCRLNGITRSTTLRIGRRLIVRMDTTPEQVSKTSQPSDDS